MKKDSGFQWISGQFHHVNLPDFGGTTKEVLQRGAAGLVSVSLFAHLARGTRQQRGHEFGSRHPALLRHL